MIASVSSSVRLWNVKPATPSLNGTAAKAPIDANATTANMIFFIFSSSLSTLNIEH